MNAIRIRIQQGVLILALSGVWMARGADGEEPLVVKPPQSVFIDRPGFGRDPFFPSSRVVIEPVETGPVTGFPSGLELKGLSGLAGRPLAIINNTTFAEGEKGRVKVPDRDKIRAYDLECLEIKEGAVRVRVNGHVRELTLSVE